MASVLSVVYSKHGQFWKLSQYQNGLASWPSSFENISFKVEFCINSSFVNSLTLGMEYIYILLQHRLSVVMTLLRIIITSVIGTTIQGIILCLKSMFVK